MHRPAFYGYGRCLGNRKRYPYKQRYGRYCDGEEGPRRLCDRDDRTRPEETGRLGHTISRTNLSSTATAFLLPACAALTKNSRSSTVIRTPTSGDQPLRVSQVYYYQSHRTGLKLIRTNSFPILRNKRTG